MSDTDAGGQWLTLAVLTPTMPQPSGGWIFSAAAANACYVKIKGKKDFDAVCRPPFPEDR